MAAGELTQPQYPFGKGNKKFNNAGATSRASKINTQAMGRGKVPANRMTQSKKGRRV